MPRERLIVIGGVAAGMSAASRARKRNPAMEIIVLEKGRYVSYGACGLAFLISGQVARPDDLLVYPPEFFRTKREIDIRLETEAIEIEPGRKTVHALARGTELLSLGYDRLVIAAGGAPAVRIAGAELPGVFTCNDLAGTIRLCQFLEREKPRRAVVVGSGYIGLEVAEAFRRRGLEVAVLERSGSVLEGVEPEIAERVEAVLREQDVRLRKFASVSGIAADARGRAAAVEHSAGSEPADVVVLATGIVPRATLAAAAGIAPGPTGAIAVDDRMQTSAVSIYAAGDCAETRHLVTGQPAYFPLGTTANKQGRVAGENAAGGRATFAGIVGTLATKVFALEFAKTGLNEAQARAAGFRPRRVTIESHSRARYLDGKPILLTLVWDEPSERLLGCQMLGAEGVAKRIDVAAMALHARLRIPDMLHLDLSYAPPFGPVWEAILVAANEAMKQSPR
jgi:NADPH-dependent 2,4-dienoyl-CoA reductase/sulfur reductase-like enzyme